MSPRGLRLPFIAAGFAALGATAYLMIMTTFMIYDDEGFVLLTLRNFLAGEALYDSVFTQYGPAPYIYHLILTLGGTIELTHTFGRILTAIHWVVCAAAVGWIAAHLVSRHRGLTGSFATIITFNFLWQMVSEPTHPGSFISAILAVSAALGLYGIQHRRPRLLALTIGITAAVLALTKINVGAFFIAGSGAFALLATNWPQRWQAAATGLAGVGLAALPWLLMAGNLDQPRVFGFALQASIAAMGVIWVLPRSTSEREMSPQIWWQSVGAFGLTALIIIGAVLLRGSSIAAVFAAVVLDPLRQPGNFLIPPRGASITWVVAVTAWLIVAWAGWELRRKSALSGAMRIGVAGLRILSLVGFVAYALRWASPWGAFTYLDICLPLLPVWLVPLQGRVGFAPLGFLWVALIAMPQVLHAYPVAGSQIGWGSFLTLALVAVGSVKMLSLKPPAWASQLRWVGASIVMIAATAQTGLLAKIGAQRYGNSEPLGLPGAEIIRLDAATRIALRALVQNAAVHADLLVTRPGMYSLNIWSETPTPTAQNATHWFWLLDEAKQVEIVRRLQSTRNSLFVSHRSLEDFLGRMEIPMAGPLQDYLASFYEFRFPLRGFQVFAPLAMKAAPIGFAALFRDEEQAEIVGGDSSALFRVPLLVDGIPASVEIIQFELDGSTSTVPTELERLGYFPILRNGDAVTAVQPLPAPAQIQGLIVIEGAIAGPVDFASFEDRGLIVRDAAGEVLAEALF
jgi:hypothetical protein